MSTASHKPKIIHRKKPKAPRLQGLEMDNLFLLVAAAAVLMLICGVWCHCGGQTQIRCWLGDGACGKQYSRSSSHDVYDDEESARKTPEWPAAVGVKTTKKTKKSKPKKGAKQKRAATVASPSV
eukprot:5929602-Prymnesium_polylepis.1